MKNYYEILEVNSLASKEIIDKAYRVLAKKYHPDMQEGTARIFCENKMREINEAYEVLSNEFLREQYNLELEREELQQYQASLGNEAVPKQREKPRKIVNANQSYKVGTFSALIELAREVFQSRPEVHIGGKPSRKGVFAVILTIIILIILGIILWFIPFTNGWMRELTVDNPLLSWIWK